MYNILLIFLFQIICSLFNNPIKNSNFSKGLENWYTESKIELIEGTSGTKAVKLIRNNINEDVFISQWPTWPINQKYTIGIRYKANISNGQICFSVEGYNYLDTVYLYTNNSNTKDEWVYQELTTEPTEFIEGKGVLSISFHKKAIGTFIIDEVFWYPAKIKIFSSLSINVWHSTVYNEEFEIRVALKILNSIYENGEYINLNLTLYEKDTNKEVQFLDTYKIKRTILTKYAEFIIDPSKLKPGFYYAKVDIYNNYANVYETNKQCNFRKSGEGFTKDYLKKNRKIYIDEKLRTWIDGKITFPIGLYALEDSEVNRKNWLNSPFNIIYNQGKDEVLAKYLYEKSNHKLYSIIDLGSQSATKNTDEESIKKARDYAINIIKKYKNFEGIIGYYTIDEPPVQYSYSLMNTSFAMREEDPDHFIITSIEDIYSLNVLKEGLDIVSLGCYPISNVDSLDCVSYVSIIGIKNMANAKANWGTIQIYDRTIEGKSGQNPPSELELKNMIYQNIAAGSMGLLAFDYGLLWSPKAKNPPQDEWDKIVKVFTEFKNIYSNIVYYVDEEPRYTYYFPEFIYQIPRGENVLARIWKKGHYDYILLVNMDKDKKVVNYKFKKPSPNTCIEIMSGTEVSNISMDNSINVNINIPHIGVVWLRGYDNDNICNKAVKVDPENLPKRFDDEILNDGNTFTIIIIICSSLFFAGIVAIIIFLWIKKKLCFASKLNMDDIKNEKIVE